MPNNSRRSTFGHKSVTILILAILLGIGLYLVWPDSSLQETDIFIPIDPGTPPQGLTIVSPLLQGLEVRLRGPQAVLATLTDKKPRYQLDLSGLDVGINNINIDQAKIPLPEPLIIIHHNPSHLTIRVEHEIKKQVPVIISHTGKPAVGFFVADAIPKPSAVMLRGPENVLAPVEKVQTNPINVKGLSETFKKEVALELAEGLEIVSPSKIITADIFIEEKIATKKINDIKVQGQGTPYQYTITPATINIEIKGPANSIEKLQVQKGINVYVNLKTLEPGIYVRRAAISLPVQITLFSVKPEVFTVKIENRRHPSNAAKQNKE